MPKGDVLEQCIDKKNERTEANYYRETLFTFMCNTVMEERKERKVIVTLSGMHCVL